MREEDKIFAGYMFDPRKQELKDIKHRAHEACRRFNSMDEYDPERTRVIGDILGGKGSVSLMATSHPLIAQERMGLDDEGKTTMAEYAEEIHIGNNVWIACNAVVIGGVTIGDNVVIGAGSVVTKDIPSGYLAYGNPCRPVRRITEADSMKHLILPEDTEHFTYNLR